MWLTATGERVLGGAEWELFRMGLSTLWDDIESTGDDKEPGTTNVHSFDRLSKPERLMLLAEVARGLHDRDEPSPDLTVLTESTVAAVFAQVRYLIEVEIDAECEGLEDCFTDRSSRPREMVLAAVREVYPDRDAPLPRADGDDLVVWFGLVNFMLDRILDDRDYLAADIFLDADPARSRTLKAQLGIPIDYFTAIPPTSSRQELAAIRVHLRRICRRPGAWTTPP